MGQIVICLDIGQIVICILLTAFSFLRGNSPSSGRENIGQIVKLSRQINRWLITFPVKTYTNIQIHSIYLKK